jgi:hypothetical protein
MFESPLFIGEYTNLEMYAQRNNLILVCLTSDNLSLEENSMQWHYTYARFEVMTAVVTKMPDKQPAWGRW